MTTEYLGVKQTAERLGITQGALLTLNLPEPDALIGRTRGWLPETIDEWNRNRPGRGVGGGRPRKHPKVKPATPDEPSPAPNEASCQGMDEREYPIIHVPENLILHPKRDEDGTPVLPQSWKD